MTRTTKLHFCLEMRKACTFQPLKVNKPIHIMLLYQNTRETKGVGITQVGSKVNYKK